MAKPSLGIIRQKESYLAMMRNAPGARLFRNLYADVGGEVRDILKDGQRSCASFVSFILYSFYLIETPHSTVAGVEKDLLSSGWRRTDTPHEGDVIVWEPKLQAETESAHIGFYLGNDRAISNDWETGVPAEHHYTYGTNPDGSPVRTITAMYTHDFLV